MKIAGIAAIHIVIPLPLAYAICKTTTSAQYYAYAPVLSVPFIFSLNHLQ